MHIFILSILFFILIVLLFILNKFINFKPYYDKQMQFHLESFFNEECDKSNTVDSIRSCYQEVVKGKNNYINTLENKLKTTSSKNTSDITTINKQISDINNTITTIKKNVEDSSNILKTTQNDILSKANQTTNTLKEAQEAKDKADTAASEYQ